MGGQQAGLVSTVPSTELGQPVSRCLGPGAGAGQPAGGSGQQGPWWPSTVPTCLPHTVHPTLGRGLACPWSWGEPGRQAAPAVGSTMQAVGAHVPCSFLLLALWLLSSPSFLSSLFCSCALRAGSSALFLDPLPGYSTPSRLTLCRACARAFSPQPWACRGQESS